jgi:hypothetical protein
MLDSPDKVALELLRQERRGLVGRRGHEGNVAILLQTAGALLVFQQPERVQTVDRAHERRVDAIAEHAADVVGHRPRGFP